MLLTTTSHPAKTTKVGAQVCIMSASETLEIKAPDEVLGVTVPEGKQWIVNISVSITETAA